jgi:hypothetical protein
MDLLLRFLFVILVAQNVSLEDLDLVKRRVKRVTNGQPAKEGESR